VRNLHHRTDFSYPLHWSGDELGPKQSINELAVGEGSVHIVQAREISVSCRLRVDKPSASSVVLKWVLRASVVPVFTDL